MMLSVVIPTLNEEHGVGAIINDLRALGVAYEVIVADGGSADGTIAVAERGGASIVRAPRGRGSQLIAGARAATGQMLCFLHADARLHEPARRELERLVESQASGAFAFRFRIDAPGWRYRFIEFGAHIRARLFRLPYGDQGLIVSRAIYDAAGGYRDLPLMEDVALVDALRAVTVVGALRAPLPVSARRWEREGPLTRMLRNWRLMLAYRLGTSPHQLAARYRPHGDAPSVGHDSAVRG